MKYHRRSIRLDNYDYSKHGYYFVTVCCEDRKNIFGEINQMMDGHKTRPYMPTMTGKEMILNNVGIMVERIILEYFNKNKFIELDEFIVMPDHVHMIVVIKNKFNNVGAGLVPALNNNEMVGMDINTRATTRVASTGNKTLGIIVGELKSLITNEYIKNVKQNNWPKFEKRLWQRNYYERIIRNEKEYLGYKKYIKENPVNYENQKPRRVAGFEFFCLRRIISTQLERRQLLILLLHH